MANGDGAGVGRRSEAKDSPLQIAKQMTATMCRQPKEAHWLGVRMENCLRLFEKRMGGRGWSCFERSHGNSVRLSNPGHREAALAPVTRLSRLFIH